MIEQFDEWDIKDPYYTEQEISYNIHRLMKRMNEIIELLDKIEEARKKTQR